MELEALKAVDHRKSLLSEIVPEGFIQFGHLQPNPLAEGATWSGSLLLSGFYTLLDGSVVLHPVQQREYGVVHFPDTSSSWPGGPPVSWWLTAGLGCGGHLTRCLAAGDAGGILIVIVPLHCRELWCHIDPP